MIKFDPLTILSLFLHDRLENMVGRWLHCLRRRRQSTSLTQPMMLRHLFDSTLSDWQTRNLFYTDSVRCMWGMCGMMYDGTIVVPVTLAPLSCCTAIGVLAASHRTPSKPKSRLPIYKYWYRSEKLLQQLIITRFLFICINILIHGSRDPRYDWNKTQNTEQLLVYINNLMT